MASISTEKKRKLYSLSLGFLPRKTLEVCLVRACALWASRSFFDCSLHLKMQPTWQKVRYLGALAARMQQMPARAAWRSAKFWQWGSLQSVLMPGRAQQPCGGDASCRESVVATLVVARFFPECQLQEALGRWLAEGAQGAEVGFSTISHLRFLW